MPSRLRISLVIPVYNEEGHLAACLRAALKQTKPFYEIIVVDNNSSDDTVAIAAQFPGVTVLHELRQGVVFARDKGFDAANGDIIARIDADTRIPKDWATMLQHIFMDESVAAVTGKMEYYEIGLPKVFTRVDLLLRRYYASVLGPHMALQAANMAVRQKVWQGTRDHVCRSPGLHEDFELAIHAEQLGHRVVFDERLVAAISFRQAGSSFAAFARYFWFCPKTYQVHGVKRGRHLYPAVFFLIACYPLFRILYRGFDQSQGRFSLRRLVLNDVAVRVNPVTFVD